MCIRDRGSDQSWGCVLRVGDGGLEAVPPAGSRGRAPGQGSRGRNPLKLKHFWLLDIQWILQICYVFRNLKKKSDFAVVFAKTV